MVQRAAKQLTEITDGIWAAETTVGIGLGTHLPLRMTVLRDGLGLVLVSPIAIDDALAAEIAVLGNVRTIVGPNLLHHQHLGDAKARYPQARLLGAPGLADKRTDLDFQGTVDTGSLSAAIETRRIDGADKLSEVVLFHKPSQTLVVTDIVFNISAATGMTWFVLKFLSGALGRLEQSRLLRVLTGDRQATAQSVQGVLDWPFERLVMAHGDVVLTDAKPRLRAGLWWWLGASRRG